MKQERLPIKRTDLEKLAIEYKEALENKGRCDLMVEACEENLRMAMRKNKVNALTVEGKNFTIKVTPGKEKVVIK